MLHLRPGPPALAGCHLLHETNTGANRPEAEGVRRVCEDGPSNFFEGGEKAVTEFIRMLVPFLRRFATFLVSCDGGDVDDLVQQTIIRIWRSANKFDPEVASVKTWARAIMRNCHSDEMRKRKRCPPTVPLGHDADSSGARRDERLPAASAQPDEEVATRLDIKAAMASLDDDKRLLVWLVDGERHSVDAAARELGLNPSTARYHLLRARQELRALLNISDNNPDEECG